MKKILSLLSAAILLGTALLPAADTGVTTIFAAATDTVANLPENLLILGDSISSGYGLENYSPEDKSKAASYGNLLAESYGISDHYTNLAVDGMTSGGLLELLESGAADDVLSTTPVIVMSIGGNDMLGELLSFIQNDLDITVMSSQAAIAEAFQDTKIIAKFQGVLTNIAKNLEQFDGNIIAITDYIHAKNSNALIFVQTLYNPFEEFNSIPLINTAASGNISTLNGKIQKNAEQDAKTRYYLIDTAAAFTGQNTALTNIQEGDIHPNAAGHLLISQLAKQAIDQVLAEQALQTIAEDSDSAAEPETTTAQTDVSSLPNESTDATSADRESKTPVVPFVLLGVAILVFGASIVLYFFRRLRNGK